MGLGQSRVEAQIVWSLRLTSRCREPNSKRVTFEDILPLSELIQLH
jgi:hypothetical protein